jgi:gas vesicle protein
MISKLLTGLAAGILIGILIAPEKGSASRQKIADSGKNMGNRLNNFVSGIKSKISKSRVTIDDYAPEASGF